MTQKRKDARTSHSLALTSRGPSSNGDKLIDCCGWCHPCSFYTILYSLYSPGGKSTLHPRTRARYCFRIMFSRSHPMCRIVFCCTRPRRRSHALPDSWCVSHMCAAQTYFQMQKRPIRMLRRHLSTMRQSVNIVQAHFWNVFFLKVAILSTLLTMSLSFKKN
jgi:hypothetical protein